MQRDKRVRTHLKEGLTVLRRLLFLVVLGAILLDIWGILARKTVYGTENDPLLLKVGGFWNEPEDSMDVVAAGSSHLYCAMSPVVLYQQTGLRSYVLGTQQQPPLATYYYLKEAFRNQSPEVVIVEGYLFLSDHETVNPGVAHDAIDPFPASLNKLRLIRELEVEGSKETYYVNLLRFHDRWKELTQADFTFDSTGADDPLHGYMFFSGVGESDCRQVCYDGVSAVPLREENLQILLDIKALAEEKGARMLLLLVPFPTEEADRGKILTLTRFAGENGIDVLDMNTLVDAIGLDSSADFYDWSHLNVKGAEKVTGFLGGYLTERYGFVPGDAGDDAAWQADIIAYEQKKQSQSSG